VKCLKIITVIANVLFEVLLWTKHILSSFNELFHSMDTIIIIRCENLGPEELRNLPKVNQLRSAELGFKTRQTCTTTV
jgi:hypothetical protein